MTKRFFTASTCALLLLLPACGSGAGGEAPPRPSGKATEVVDCLKKDKVNATAGKSGAKLVDTKTAQDAVVVRFKGNVANVAFFESKEAASDAKGQLKNEELSNIEEDILIVFQKRAKPAQEEQIDDCLPDEEEDQQREDEQKK